MPITPTGRIVYGTNNAETLEGSNWGNDKIYGYQGADSLFGYKGNDTLIGGIDGANDYINGGWGFDTVDYSETNLDMTIDLSAGTASVDAQLVFGSTQFGDYMYYHPGALEDTLISIEGVNAGGGDDTIIGNNRANTLNGNDGNDIINGLGGDDELDGGDGDDIINGGKGQDKMSGGDGDDTFVFSDASEISGDFIRDFVTGEDTIDLSAIDANPMQRGDQAFVVSENGFTGKAGQLAEIDYLSSEFSEVWGGDLDGDGNADFVFAVHVSSGNSHTLSESDFLL